MLVDKIVYSLVEDGIISDSEMDIVRFGLESLKNNIISVLMILGIGAIFKEITEAILVWMLLFPLRKTVGGYHASSKEKCFMLTIGVFFVAFLLDYIYVWSTTVLIISSIILGGIIWRFSPIDNPVKKFDQIAYKVYKKRCRIILLCEGFMLLVAACHGWSKVIRCVFMTIFIMCISVIMGIVLYQKSE